MRQYFSGYYCRDSTDLQILNKNSNRDILQTLLFAHPSSLDAQDLAKKTRLPIKTVYSQMRELYREYFTQELFNKEQPKPRGRPPENKRKSKRTDRDHIELIVENANYIFDTSDEDTERKFPLPPGHVKYSKEFDDFSRKILALHYNDISKIEEELYDQILHFMSSMLRITTNLREYAPESGSEHCCYQCGVNHEARDLLRAVTLSVLDGVEESKAYVDLLKDYGYITQAGYQHALSKIEEEESFEKYLWPPKSASQRTHELQKNKK